MAEQLYDKAVLELKSDFTTQSLEKVCSKFLKFGLQHVGKAVQLVKLKPGQSVSKQNFRLFVRAVCYLSKNKEPSFEQLQNLPDLLRSKTKAKKEVPDTKQSVSGSPQQERQVEAKKEEAIITEPVKPVGLLDRLTQQVQQHKTGWVRSAFVFSKDIEYCLEWRGRRISRRHSIIREFRSAIMLDENDLVVPAVSEVGFTNSLKSVDLHVLIGEVEVLLTYLLEHREDYLTQLMQLHQDREESAQIFRDGLLTVLSLGQSKPPKSIGDQEEADRLDQYIHVLSNAKQGLLKSAELVSSVRLFQLLTLCVCLLSKTIGCKDAVARGESDMWEMKQTKRVRQWLVSLEPATAMLLEWTSQLIQCELSGVACQSVI